MPADWPNKCGIESRFLHTDCELPAPCLQPHGPPRPIQSTHIVFCVWRCIHRETYVPRSPATKRPARGSTMYPLQYVLQDMVILSLTARCAGAASRVANASEVQRRKQVRMQSACMMHENSTLRQRLERASTPALHEAPVATQQRTVGGSCATTAATRATAAHPLHDTTLLSEGAIDQLSQDTT